jgi:hypothetical protein
VSAQYCEQHDLIVSDGAPCPACVAAQRRDLINSLKAQVDDQAAELVQLRTRVVELEHLVRGQRRRESVL